MKPKNGIFTKEESETLEKRGNGNIPSCSRNFLSRKYKRKRPKVYDSTIGYDFLQYSRVVFMWATKKYEISRPHLELLLFLHPQGYFLSSLFMKACRIHTIVPLSLMKKLRMDGFIAIWRESNRNKGQKRLYCLSHKARLMCSRVHSIMAGDEKIPEFANPFLNEEVTIHKYYMNIISDMNKRNEERIELRKKEKASE